MANQPLVTIAEYTNALQAHIARGRLEAEGLEVHIADEHYITMNWYLSNALGGVKLQVAENKIEQAKEVLAAIEAGDYEIQESKEDQSSIECPRCHSSKVTQKSMRGWALSIFYLSNIPCFFKSRYQCSQCQFQWKAMKK